MKILVTGGCGFIGSALVRMLISSTEHSVLNIDKLTYAGNQASLASVLPSARYSFFQADICGRKEIEKAFRDYAPDAVIHLAAESHVDRSIDGPGDFIQTNIVGTYTMLEAARSYWSSLSEERKSTFRFLHVSTDEVYGDLGDTEALFSEDTPYDPSSPYSASKASSDHLVRAWFRTFGLPTMITNCSNNYGPYHFPEKLIPHIILSALAGKALPVYGDGKQIRDWLYVEDHVRALYSVLLNADPGQTYNIGGNNEKENIAVVRLICDMLDELVPERRPKAIRSFNDLITFVKDRPGHDKRYAIDASKIMNELGWSPQESFETGIRKTVLWYLENDGWWQDVLNGTYRLGRIGASV